MAQDLLRDWIVTLVHGGRFNRLGRVRHRWVPDPAAGLRDLQALHRRRLRRGYTLTQVDIDPPDVLVWEPMPLPCRPGRYPEQEVV